MLRIALLILCCTISSASSLQSVRLTLVPDTFAPPTLESLNSAKEILQKRLDIALPEKSRLSISDNNLKLELASREYVDVATRLATEIGAVVFFLSDTAKDVGSAIPDNIDPVVTDKDIIQAKPSLAQGNYWSIRITFSEEGAKRLQHYTRGNIGRYMVIAKDGAVVSAPIIRSEINGNEVEIAGTEDINVARLVVAQLNSGRLLYKFRIAESR